MRECPPPTTTTTTTDSPFFDHYLAFGAAELRHLFPRVERAVRVSRRACEGEGGGGGWGCKSRGSTHEVRYDAVKRQPIVVALLGQCNEVAGGHGHLVHVQLELEGAHARLAVRHGVCHHGDGSPVERPLGRSGSCKRSEGERGCRTKGHGGDEHSEHQGG